ncbi:uncharacterized protein LOC112576045 [Pomacea canaliculata]|uniref:uncharacterized protein LOC112576045 n=1 Tax=Pomacea canaliculata TaxID=400727 RepID=UPI000D73E6F5|nr:uncharacterized protein LOC112576045 [Pomacea canaliculata]
MFLSTKVKTFILKHVFFAGDHYLTKYEFLAAHPNEEGTAFFNFYDKLDGTADHRVARVVAEKILQHLDKDNNGEIPYSEFQHSYPLFYAEVMKEKRVLAHW